MKRPLGKIVGTFLVFVLATGAATRAQAQTFTVLHSFTNSPDGAFPFAGLLRDAAGNLYGTTLRGGSLGSGTVFKLDPAGNETVLYSFTDTGSPADGLDPYAAPVMDTAGNLYGTTRDGGFFGIGIVFRLDPSGHETVLHTFAPAEGGDPYAGVVMDAAGNLYGTTSAALALGVLGTVFKIDTAGNFTVLHFFTGSDGCSPSGGVIIAEGNFYGTASGCGSFGFGTVFKLDPLGNVTVLYSFKGGSTGGSDGAAPTGGLIMDAAGNLYGTTIAGGSSNAGTVFKLDPSGNETVLYSFKGGSDGASPYLGSLITDAAGNLYGTASSFLALGGFGTVFKLTVQTPAPTINSISPTSAIAGGAGFTLTVNGTNFVSGAGVSFNGNARTTTFVGATQLTAAILASDIASAGTFNVTVTNPGGQTSNAVTFTVVTPEQATQTIINSVNALFSQGVLNGGQDNSLVVQLQHAIGMMNAGKNNGAIGNLDSFISEVNDLLSSGVLSASQAASLIGAAESVIAAL